jgi:hypothetical protein
LKKKVLADRGLPPTESMYLPPDSDAYPAVARLRDGPQLGRGLVISRAAAEVWVGEDLCGDESAATAPSQRLNA